MNETRRVALFRNGRSQVIQIPREFELEGSEALLRKEGRCLIIEPLPHEGGLLDLLAGWAPLNEGTPEIADPVPPAEDPL